MTILAQHVTDTSMILNPRGYKLVEVPISKDGTFLGSIRQILDDGCECSDKELFRRALFDLLGSPIVSDNKVIGEITDVDVDADKFVGRLYKEDER